jgi:hypothetical protein
MISRLHWVFPLLCIVACERSAMRQATDSSATSSTTVTVVATQSVPPPSDPSKVEDSVFDTFGIDSPDSSYGAWDRDGFVSGDHVRHPSGLMILWLDTAVRATDGRPARRTHVDSLVITGLEPSEGLGHFCNGKTGAGANHVVGLVRDTAINHQPRLAWLLDEKTFRIKPTPTDSLVCFLRDPMEHDEVD